jgi:SAM-dependent methyltransferase
MPRLPQSLAEVRDYYDRKVRTHGPTPRGVDWPCAETQDLRFTQLLKLCDFSKPRSLNDLGCGYGALLGYLRRHHPHTPIDYRGIDLAASMVEEARRQHCAESAQTFCVSRSCGRIADYSVASGIFNVKLEARTHDWEKLVASVLQDLCRYSRLGFAVNFIEPAGAGVDSPHQLYRVAPDHWADYCREVLGYSVEIVADYGLPEYTLVARARSRSGISISAPVT